MVKRTAGRVYVIGAGMSGLSAALRLAELGVPTTLIEKEKKVGGLAASFAWGEFKHLDQGPHIFHTPDAEQERYWKKHFGDLFYENEFWGKNVKGEKFNEYFDYPLSYASIKKLPEATRKKVLNELSHLDDVKRAKAKSYAEYVRELVGPTLMEMFFIRYPQKLWGVSINEMTANWAPKRVNLRTKHEHFHAGQWSAVGKFGSGKILERMAEKFRRAGGQLVLNSEITSIERERGWITALVAGGKRFEVKARDKIISTMPLPRMAELLGIENSLRYRGAKLVFVALKKPTAIPKDFNFLYYDAPEIIFHRVSEQKKFCPVGFPKNNTVLSCEIAFTRGDELDRQDAASLEQRAAHDLVRVGLAKKEEIYDTMTISLPYVYPLSVRGIEEELTEVRGRLAAYKQLYGVGTGGDFHYADLQILHLKGVDLAERLVSGEEGEEELVKKDHSFEFNQRVHLGSRAVGDGEQAFIIAEAGLNHNGSLKLALELIDRAADIGCSAVKFQTYRAGNRVSKKVKGNRYAEKLIDTEESTFDMLERLELSYDEHVKLFKHAKKRGIEIFSTPFDLESVDTLEALGCAFYKISSMDLVNIPLIKKVAATGKPLIISTGMSTLGQVEDAVNAVRETGNKNLILLHCVSSYPAAPQDLNLKAMETLRESFGVPVGFSDHSIGIAASVVALAQGACVVERHFTLDRFMEGPDHILSSDVEEMRELVRMSRLIPVMQGDGKKVILHSEVDTVNRFKKSLYAAKDIRKGQRITESHVAIKGPGGGILPKYLDTVIGRVARATIKRDHPIRWEDV